jgi:hypothetical protein
MAPSRLLCAFESGPGESCAKTTTGDNTNRAAHVKQPATRIQPAGADRRVHAGENSFPLILITIQTFATGISIGSPFSNSSTAK